MDTGGISLDSIFKLAEIVSILSGGSFVAFRLGRTSKNVETALAIHAQAFVSTRDDVIDLKKDVKELNAVLTSVALQGQRLDMISQQLNTLDKRYDELRHGDGWVNKNNRGGVSGEYSG